MPGAVRTMSSFFHLVHLSVSVFGIKLTNLLLQSIHFERQNCIVLFSLSFFFVASSTTFVSFFLLRRSSLRFGCPAREKGTEGPHAGVGQATAQASSRPIISNSPWAPAELGQPAFDWLVARPPLPALRLAHLASRLQKSTGFSENR
jgi:hypothetical protein